MNVLNGACRFDHIGIFTFFQEFSQAPPPFLLVDSQSFRVALVRVGVANH